MFGRLGRLIDKEIQEHAIARTSVGGATAMFISLLYTISSDSGVKPNRLVLLPLAALTGMITGATSKPSAEKNGPFYGACFGWMPSIVISSVILCNDKKDDSLTSAAYNTVVFCLFHSIFAAITSNITHHLLDNNHRSSRRP